MGNLKGAICLRRYEQDEEEIKHGIKEEELIEEENILGK